ncbi:LA2681 family HEPN domain-containing protein [Luteimonas sp. TWI406]|uniref:LA2681 family HEPN domain-containing protein n=1 Tax=Luteimonas sp. TWI406 TaxID=3136777 RepID=UPI00320AEDBE
MSARFMLWESGKSEEAHFSDRDVLLLNTLDYPAFGLATEQLKMAFRVAYSIFDKIAFFLNRYLALGMGPRQVNFRAVWTEGKNKALRSRIAGSKNWPLRGLYWLSKDLFEEGAQDLLEPDARRIA